MRKSCYLLLISFFFSFVLIISDTASATSWVELKPQEVVNRAEVIVTGKYDFTSKPKPSRFIFQGHDFKIKNVYKGEVSEQIITAGIDYNDTGWAEEFQNEDGEFLLLLEKSKDADFLIPVGGPNGMIQIYNGKIEESNDERRTFFEDILTTQPLKIMATKVENDNDSQYDNSNLLLYVSTSALVGLAVLLLLYLYKRNKIINDKL